MTVFITTFMVEKFGVSATIATLYALLMYVVQFVFSYIAAGLADFFGRRFSAILGAVIMMTATAAGALSEHLGVLPGVRNGVHSYPGLAVGRR
jgi:putative MFS transporter